MLRSHVVYVLFGKCKSHDMYLYVNCWANEKAFDLKTMNKLLKESLWFSFFIHEYPYGAIKGKNNCILNSKYQVFRSNSNIFNKIASISTISGHFKKFIALKKAPNTRALEALSKKIWRLNISINSSHFNMMIIKFYFKINLQRFLPFFIIFTMSTRRVTQVFRGCIPLLGT